MVCGFFLIFVSKHLPGKIVVNYLLFIFDSVNIYLVGLGDIIPLQKEEVDQAENFSDILDHE